MPLDLPNLLIGVFAVTEVLKRQPGVTLDGRPGRGGQPPESDRNTRQRPSHGQAPWKVSG